MRAKEKYVKILLKALLCILLAAVCTFFNREVTQLLAFITVQSVKTYLPQKGVSFTLTEEAAEIQPVTEVTSQPEATTVSTVKPQAISTSKNTLTLIDADIKKLISNAEKNASKDKKDGDIYEYTYTDDGVTDEYEGVRVKNTNKTQIDIEKKLKERLTLTVEKGKPAVIIYHTHTTETYQLLDRDFYAQGYLSRSNDKNQNMVRVGKAVADEIEKQGFTVIHDTAIYDNPYSGAYYRSEDAVEKLGRNANTATVISLLKADFRST